MPRKVSIRDFEKTAHTVPANASMRAPDPAPPADLDPLAREILASLAAAGVGGSIVIGGGVALKHYLNLRSTVDLDAWWSEPPTRRAAEEVERVVRGVAQRNGLKLERRSWGDTLSLDLSRGEQKVFSFQIALRDRQLEPYVASEWPPVLLESLADNLASKMTALVQRGAPRDFVDVHALVEAGLVTTEDCWRVAGETPGPAGRIRALGGGSEDRGAVPPAPAGFDRRPYRPGNRRRRPRVDSPLVGWRATIRFKGGKREWPLKRAQLPNTSTRVCTPIDRRRPRRSPMPNVRSICTGFARAGTSASSPNPVRCERSLAGGERPTPLPSPIRPPTTPCGP